MRRATDRKAGHLACPETALLACCARTRVTPDRSRQAQDLVRSGIDWDFLLQLAARHGVTPLFSRGLRLMALDGVPSEVARTLQAEFQSNAFHSLSLLKETLHLLAVFEAGGVQAIPLKGPLTGLTAYGDISLRDSVDIDILVRPEDVSSAAAVLRGEGYAPEQPVEVTEVQSRAVIGLCQHERFLGEAGAAEVELHWRPAPLAYAPAPAHWNFWDRCRTISCWGRNVSLPAPEDQLLLLCLHGYTHLFSCLKWVCDIAELVRSHPDLAHESALQEANRLGCSRVVDLGYLLAADLLDAPVPPQVLARARGDRGAESVAREVQRRFHRAEPIPVGLTAQVRDLRLRLRALDRVGQRLRFCFRRVAPYTKRDVAWLRLPAWLLPLYWVTGPVRLLKQAWRRREAPERGPRPGPPPS